MSGKALGTVRRGRLKAAKKNETTIRRRFYGAMLRNTLLALLALTAGVCAVFAIYFVRFESVSSKNQLGHIGQQIDFLRISVENFSKTVRINETAQMILRNYRADPDDYRYRAANDVSAQLHSIIQSTPYIHSVSLYGADGALLVSTDLRPPADRLDSSQMADFARWIRSSKHGVSGTRELQPAFSFLSPCFAIDSGAFLGHVEIAIPESKISEIYRPYITDNFSVFIVDGEGIIRSHSDQKTVGEPYPRFSELLLGDIVIGQKAVFSVYYSHFDWRIISEISATSFFEPLLGAILLLLAMSAACMFLESVVSGRVSRTITSALRQLVRHIGSIREGRWTTVSDSAASDSDTRALFIAFNEMITAQEALKNNLVEAERKRSLLSLSSLQQQVNPHFLYNTLDNIASLTEIGEYDISIEMVMNLSAFYRASLNHGAYIVTLRDELSIAANYLKIMQIRKHNGFDHKINCAKNIEDLRILKLLLQPIVENSIEHGFKGLNKKGLITIDVSEPDEDSLIIEVTDNGLGMREPFDIEHARSAPMRYGLYNVDRRIKLCYGEQYGVFIRNVPGGGCETRLRISRKEPEDDTLPGVNR